MDSRSLSDLWLDLAYHLAGGDDFWAGVWATVLFFVTLYLVTGPLFAWLAWLHAKVRQAFKPTVKPAKLPTEEGPSPMGSCGIAVLAGAAILIVVVLSAIYVYCSVLGGPCS